MHNPIACLGKVSITVNIFARLDVVRESVELDYQVLLAAEEVGEKRSDWHLTAEFHAKLGIGKITP